MSNEANFDDQYEMVGTCLIYILSPLCEKIPSHHFPSVCQCLEEVHYTLLYCQAFLSQVKLSVFNFHNLLPFSLIHIYIYIYVVVYTITWKYGLNAVNFVVFRACLATDIAYM